MDNSIVSNVNNLQILFEDNHIIIINKRSGDIVQGDKTGDIPLSDIVKLYIKEKYKKPGNVYLGVVHRLDRPTTGIVVFAKTSKALTRLNALFANKNITKTYWAIVKKKPEFDKDTLTHWLRKNPKNNKSYAYKNEIEGSKKAILDYKIIKALSTYYLTEINLRTGRHHQIRVQLSSIGSPIKGDLKYGFNRSNPDGSICLHSRQLTFVHPVTKNEVKIVAPVPDTSIWKACVS